jgi:hypothetical protein
MAPQHKRGEYESMHIAMSMKYLSLLYKKDFLEHFYDPCFRAFIQTELDADKS